MTNTSKLKVSGILFIATAVVYILSYVLFFTDISVYIVDFSYYIFYYVDDIIFTTLWYAIIAVWCLVIRKYKFSKTYLSLALAFNIFINVYFFFINHALYLYEVFRYLIDILMICILFKPNKTISIIGNITFILYALFVISEYYYYILDLYSILYSACLILEFVALYIIWQTQSVRIFLKKKDSLSQPSSLEEELNSLTIRYDACIITEEEYKAKKEEIIKKL